MLQCLTSGIYLGSRFAPLEAAASPPHVSQPHRQGHPPHPDPGQVRAHCGERGGDRVSGNRSIHLF